MSRYLLCHRTHQVVLQGLATLVARGCTHTADLVAHIGEVDSRRLFLPAAHPSMFSYCVNVLHFSEQAAYKRIRVARMARRFPAIFDALAEGRVHLSGLFLLKAYMSRRNAAELLAAVTHKSCREIEKVLAERYPKEDVATRVRALPNSRVVAAAPVAGPDAAIVAETQEQLSARTVASSVRRTEEWVSPGADASAVKEPVAGLGLLTGEDSSVLRTEGRKPAKVQPLAPKRYALQLTMSQELHDKLRHAQALLSHTSPSGDVAAVLERALDLLITKLEKTKYAATENPRAIKASTSGKPRQIPAHVRRAVRKRDGDQCTFVSDDGQRCPERHFLEFDHVKPVCRGGETTADGLRLRCRAHNHYEAERLLGVLFMQRKLHEARSPHPVQEHARGVLP